MDCHTLSKNARGAYQLISDFKNSFPRQQGGSLMLILK